MSHNPHSREDRHRGNGHGRSAASHPEPGQQRATPQGRCAERRHVGVTAVVGWPTHVDDQRIDIGRTQAVDSLSGKGMLMDVATNDEYRLVGLKGRQTRLLRRNHVRRYCRPPWCRARGDIRLCLEAHDRVSTGCPGPPVRRSRLEIERVSQLGLAPRPPARRQVRRLPGCQPRGS